ncbi:MAG: hypothetical protein QM726_15255 [Chitinophagaceae bacterium]
MKVPVILLDFMRLGEVNLDARATSVSNGMTDNPYFTNPNPALKELDMVRQEFTNARAAAQNRDVLKIALKNEVKEKLRDVLLKLSYYVESVALGNRAILISSGFKVSSETTEPEADAINDFTVKHGKLSGQMILSASRVKGYTIYTFFYGVGEGENIVWNQVPQTKATAILSDLQVGKTYTFYMEAKGANGKIIQSVRISKVVS